MGKYQAYPDYKDSGVIGLDKIPLGWSIKKVKYLFNIGRGRVISQEELVDEGEFPVYSSQTANDGCLGYISSYDFDCEQITWTTDGANAGTVFLRKGKHNCTNVCGTLQPKSEEQNLKFFLYCLQYVTQFYKRPDTNGAKIMNGEMAEIVITEPTDNDKLTIANFLDHETAKIDTLIEQQQKLIQLLKEKRQAVFSHAVTKGLNPNASMKDSGVEWLGQVPVHWRIGKCGFYISILSGFAFPSSGFSDNENDIKLLRGINVGVSHLKWNETVYWKREYGDGLDIYEMKAGDLVIGMDRPLISEGIRVAKVTDSDLPCLLLQRVASLKTGNELDSDYLFAFLSSEMFASYFSPDTTGVSVPHISPDQISNFVIAIPPIDEQRAIAKYLYVEKSKLKSLIEEAEFANMLLQERRTALISAAVTGKIDVRNWQAPQQ